MELLSSAVLHDAAFRVPAAAPGEAGMAWLRGHVARFVDGVDLADAWFGAGPHRCPGEALALRLAEEALATTGPAGAHPGALIARPGEIPGPVEGGPA